jgi:hypothetical protein
MTAIEETNISKAANQGVTSPTAAKGMVKICHPSEPYRFCLATVLVRVKS